MVIEDSGKSGSKKRVKAKLCIRVFQVTRNSWFNSFPTDLEFITWKHKEIRQNTNSLPQLTTVELSNKSHGTTVRGVVCSSKILVTQLLPLSLLLPTLLRHSPASALPTHSFCSFKDSTALGLLITAFASFLSLNSQFPASPRPLRARPAPRPRWPGAGAVGARAETWELAGAGGRRTARAQRPTRPRGNASARPRLRFEPEAPPPHSANQRAGWPPPGDPLWVRRGPAPGPPLLRGGLRRGRPAAR